MTSDCKDVFSKKVYTSLLIVLIGNSNFSAILEMNLIHPKWASTRVFTFNI